VSGRRREVRFPLISRHDENRMQHNTSNAFVPAPLLAALLLAACQAQAPAAGDRAVPAAAHADAATASADLVERGAYLAVTGGCNDCHTAGYPESGGQVPRERWLTGSPLGWQDPWGTTYAANLRLKAAGMDEAGWLHYTAELHARPPMPDFNVRAMSEDDRRALYRFIRALGPAGEPAPAYLPPGTDAPLPYVKWMLPPPAAAAASAPAAG
jgi:mono/diheme cytochrome c family protein